MRKTFRMMFRMLSSLSFCLDVFQSKATTSTKLTLITLAHTDPSFPQLPLPWP